LLPETAVRWVSPELRIASEPAVQVAGVPHDQAGQQAGRVARATSDRSAQAGAQLLGRPAYRTRRGALHRVTLPAEGGDDVVARSAGRQPPADLDLLAPLQVLPARVAERQDLRAHHRLGTAADHLVHGQSHHDLAAAPEPRRREHPWVGRHRRPQRDAGALPGELTDRTHAAQPAMQEQSGKRQGGRSEREGHGGATP
jgi:hypothetical protein